MDDGSRKAQQLTLSGREVISSLPHLLIQTMLQLVNKMIGIYILADATDFFIRNALFPQNDVAADRAGEQKYILQHLTKMPAQGSDLDLANVDTVDQNLALLELVVAADQGQDCALSGTGRSDKRHRFSRIYMERHTLQHPFPGNIGKPHIAKLDFAVHLFQLYGIGRIYQLRLQIHDREHLFRRRQSRLQPVKLLCQVLDRGEKFRNIHIKGNDRSACDRLS